MVTTRSSWTVAGATQLSLHSPVRLWRASLSASSTSVFRRVFAVSEGLMIAGFPFQKKQTDHTRSTALSILTATPDNRGSGALEAGGLEPASPGTVSARRIVMRSHPDRPVPP